MTDLNILICSYNINGVPYKIAIQKERSVFFVCCKKEEKNLFVNVKYVIYCVLQSLNVNFLAVLYNSRTFPGEVSQITHYLNI